MSFIYNSAEGGVTGTAVTTDNSGGLSGNAFDTVTSGTNAVWTFSADTAAHGTQSLAATSPSTTSMTVQWTQFDTSSIAVRIYFNMGSSVYSAHARLIDIRSSSISLARINLNNSTNRIYAQDYNGGSTKWTASFPLNPNTWYRIELAISVSSTNGIMNAALFQQDSIDPVGPTLATTTANTGSSNIASVVIGNLQNSSWNNTSYYDSLAVNTDTTDLIGPYLPKTAGSMWVAA